MKTHRSLLVAAACALPALLPSAHAALSVGSRILIDFGRNDTTNGIISPAAGTMDTANGNSTHVADGFGNHWNNAWINSAVGGGITPPSLTNLVNSADVGTGVGLSFSGGWQSNGFNNGGLQSPTVGLLGDFASRNVTGDYFFLNAGDSTAPLTMTLSGFDPALSYDFKIFASRLATNGTDVRSSIYSITDANGLHTYTLQTTGTNIGADGAYDANDDEFALLNGIVPDGVGNITLSLRNGTSSFAYISALQVTAVPEPSAALLSAGAALALLVRRRRA